MNQKYEVLFILEPNLTDEQVKEQGDKVQELVTRNGGTVEKLEVWGKRRLAYPIQRRRDGIYILVLLETDTRNQVLPELNRHLRITEQIVRSMVTVAVVGKSKGRELTQDEIARFMPRGGGRRPGGPPREGGYRRHDGEGGGYRGGYRGGDRGAAPAAAPAEAPAAAPEAPASNA